jgi:hypothetical protein
MHESPSIWQNDRWENMRLPDFKKRRGTVDVKLPELKKEKKRAKKLTW